MPVRIGQFGTKHGHARGKWRAMVTNPDVEPVAIWEPDADRRAAEQGQEQYAGARWAASADELLADPAVTAIAIEGLNSESLAMARAAVDAGKHLWYDKPAGDSWPEFRSLIDKMRERSLYLQMGYMFRYQPGFQQIATWSRTGVLGDVYAIRAHMSTSINLAARKVISVHRGGIFYDLAAHMIDQVVWHLGSPYRVQLFARNDTTPSLPHFADNTLGVFEFDEALATIEIAAMEPRPSARRFEVYGTKGSAITEPFDPGDVIRLALTEPHDEYAAGEHIIKLPTVTRQQMYERELAAFVATINGSQEPDRPLRHEILVQETLLRATGGIPG